MKNVLYLGMGGDIMSPLIIEPDLDVLFVIDEFDFCYSSDCTEEGQKKDIILILEKGSNEHSIRRASAILYKNQGYNEYENADEINYLPQGKSVILESKENQGKWELIFEYGGKKRKLVRYRFNFYDSIWPAEIKNVMTVLSIGAVSPGHFCPEENNLIYPNKLKPMISERTTNPFAYWSLYFLHEHLSDPVYLKIDANIRPLAKIECTPGINNVSATKLYTPKFQSTLDKTTDSSDELREDLSKLEIAGSTNKRIGLD